MERSSASSVLPAAARAALVDLESLTDRLVTEIEAHTADYRTSVRLDPAVLRADCRRNLVVHLGVLAGQPDDAFRSAALETGRARAEVEMPLDAVLRAYRVGGRVICDALIAHATADTAAALLREMPRLWALVDRSSALVAEGYTEVERRARRRLTARRSEQVAALLAGGLAAPDARAAADQLGLAGAPALVIVCIAGWSPTAAAPAKVLADSGIRSAWMASGAGHAGIVCNDPAIVQALARTADQHPGARIAIGPAARDVLALPSTHRLASTLLGALGHGEIRRVEESLPRLLLAAAPDVHELLRRRVLDPFDGLAPDERDELLRTVIAYIAGGCTALVAAAALGCHRNTVAQRLRRLAEVTGRPLDADHLLELQLALA